MRRHLWVALALGGMLVASGCGRYLPSGIQGRVVATSECPQGTPCQADPNVEMWLTFARLPQRILGIPLAHSPEVDARIYTEAGGVFRLDLLPGRYVVYGDPSAEGHAAVCQGRVTVIVTPHHFVPVSIDCAPRG